MSEPKLPNLIFGTVISWWLAGMSWAAGHPGQVASILASLASLLTMWASWRAGVYWRNRELDRKADKRQEARK